MKKKLIARTVKVLVPGPRIYAVRDTEITGFLLRVYPSGKMVYFLDYRTKAGIRKTYRIGPTGNLTVTQARDIAEVKAADVALGIDIQAEKQKERKEAALRKISTFGGFLEHKYKDYATAHHKTGAITVKRLEANFKDLLTKPLVEITEWSIEKWRTQEIKRGKEASTINRDITALKAALNTAVKWQLLSENPIAGLKRLKVDDTAEPRHLAQREEKRLREALDKREIKIREERASANEWRRVRGYEALPDLTDKTYADHLKPMVFVALNTGMRRGELFNLSWPDVEFSRSRLTVVGTMAKSGKTRHIPLNQEAREALRAWKAQGEGKGLVFPGKEGKRLDNVRKAWNGVLSEAKIKSFRWHDLRHTFASNLVMAGVPLVTVKELLGHHSITMTEKYAHLATDHKEQAVARLVS